MNENINNDGSSDVSSSQMDDGDVTLICHKDSLPLIEQIEDRLSATYKVLRYQCIAGRSEVSNLMSRVRHAKFKVIFLLDDDANKLEKLIELVEPTDMLGCTTLVLYQNKEPTTQLLRGQVQVQVPLMDVNVGAEAVTRFIEAHKEAENEAKRDSAEKKEFFISLLVGCCIHPDPFFQKELETVFSEFEKCFGKFKHRSVNFKNFLRSAYILDVKSTGVAFSKNGRLVYRSWKLRVAEKLSLQQLQSQTPKLKSAEWLDNYETQLGSSSKIETESFESMRNILQMLEESETGSFLISDIQNTPGDLSGIAHVPWMCVFDFDVNSRKSGLFNQLEPLLKERDIKRFDYLNTIGNLHESTTKWVFMKGICEDQASVHTGEYLDWVSKHDEELDVMFRDMADFCCPDLSPVFVALWYNEKEESYDYLEEILARIRKGFDRHVTGLFPVNIWVCCPKPNDTLQKILKKYKVLSQTNTISLTDVNKCLSQVPPPKRLFNYVQLPGKDSEGKASMVDLKREVSRQISRTLEILPIDHVVTQDLMERRKDTTYGKSFLRGGEVTWDYLSRGQIAIERRIQKVSCDYIHRAINDKWKSTVVKLHHGPGGGGSTFARQLLWKLRQDAPCVLVKMPITSISEVVSHLEEVYELTAMSVVVLLDGASESDAQAILSKRNISLVIIHVMRNYEKLERRSPADDKIQLPSFVSTEEACNLLGILDHFSESNNHAMLRLKKEVDEFDIQLYEFGLTAFNAQYDGIQSYVTGYMTPYTDPALPWQQTIAYLALLLYYGQVGIRKNAFRKLLRVSGKSVQLSDLPFKGQQFVTESTKGDWKMIYPRVAKEVLEYVLVSPVAYDETKTMDGLSDSACEELPNLVIKFIGAIKAEVGSLSPPSIVWAFTKMIILRAHQPKRESLSRMLNDIKNESSRIKVLKALANAFPSISQFFAALGRQYSFARQFDEAEKALQTAVKLAKQNGDDATGKTRNTLGYCYHRQVKQLIKEKKMSKAVTCALKGIDEFNQARKLVANNFSYAYLGEIKIRLLLAEHVHKNVPGGCQSAIDGTLNTHDMPLAEIVRDSLYECRRLLDEYKSIAKPHELERMDDYEDCETKYKEFLHQIRSGSVFDTENIHLRVSEVRRRLIYLRNVNDQKKEDGSFDDSDHVREIENLYSIMLRSIFANSVHVRVSADMQAWLHFMRHSAIEDTNEIGSLIKIIECWERRVEKWGRAPFYGYVCRFLLAICSDGHMEKRQEYLSSSIKLRDSFRSARLSICDKTIELLGSHGALTVKKLIPREKLGDWDDNEKMWSNREAVMMLQVLTGSIILKKTKHASPSVGWISVDLEKPIKSKTVDVYFNPKKYKLHARSNAETRQRVEFFLGFHTYNGAEAHCVRPLKQKRCPKCGVNSDIITLKVISDVKCKKCLKSLTKRA